MSDVRLAVVALMLHAACLAAPATAAAETLTVRIVGFDAVEGDVHAALYDNAEAFPDSDKMLDEREVVLTGPAAEITFDGLEASRSYAVAVYHDANGNDEFDQGFLGIPRERYGFSRNPRVFLRAPRFEEAAVELPPEGLTVEIDLSR
jgi:uncharacterized protein (DUF2141 family)